MDRDRTDLGLPPEWGTDPYGIPIQPNAYQRGQLIEGVAERQGWAGDAESRARRRAALQRECPRETCRAAAVQPCRRRSRGRWRPIEGVHEERQPGSGSDALRAAYAVPAGAVPSDAGAS